jgi:hypothetical protein
MREGVLVPENHRNFLAYQFVDGSSLGRNIWGAQWDFSIFEWRITTNKSSGPQN